MIYLIEHDDQRPMERGNIQWPDSRHGKNFRSETIHFRSASPPNPTRQARPLTWGMQFLRNERTLQDYQIPPYGTLIVLQQIRVKIYDPEGGGFYYEYIVYDGIYVRELKAKLHADLGVVVENKVLRMGNTDLNNHALLWVAGVEDGDTLYLVECHFG
ncbi:hypothetical protein Pyn_16126 [Prunus yedoensis var. nudiflora]|uniref:Ubiquitin-like domain-containing protein n=1 Tax=Prunus yedoensis var. nudiflora TaxID=2094558 RepID=A0A314UYW1_PRUYE|nr:hypothetical protein Pyn_16126 [Prunus yedoensis var. nudiflora]